MKRTIGAIAIAVLLGSAWTTQAAVVEFSADLSGSAERPNPNQSGGFGSAGMELDTDTNRFTYDIEFGDLSGQLAGAHFHGPADEDEVADVRVGLVNPADARLMDVENEFDDDGEGELEGSLILSDLEVEELLQNLWYINLHTAEFPGGEIRGQVIGPAPIPLPAAVWMLAPALGLLGFSLRRGARRRG